MEVISFINYKGGVGKTTLSANVAAELAFRGKRVLAVDLDPQTNLTFSFIDLKTWENLDSKGMTIKHWYDEFLDRDTDFALKSLISTPVRMQQQLRRYKSKGCLDIISSHLELINLDMELASRLGGATERVMRSNFLMLFSRLKKGLEEVKDDYDVVIIDCPPNFNIVTQNAIIASDRYLVPAKPDFLSTLGIDQLVRHIDDLTEKYNKYVDESNDCTWDKISPELLGVVFTMIRIYDGKPIQVQKSYIAQVERAGYNVLESYMRCNDSLFSKAPEYGVPVVLESELAGTYADIRGEMEDIVDDICEVVSI